VRRLSRNFTARLLKVAMSSALEPVPSPTLAPKSSSRRQEIHLVKDGDNFNC
jgi:hypothetical protein